MVNAQAHLSRQEVLQGAESALRQCEAEVQRLMATAARSGLYGEINRMTEVARSLDEMATSMRSAQRLETDAGSSSLPASRQPRHKSARRGTRSKEYPKFSRDGEHLVKTGWSKKNREEYFHRARFDQVSSIVAYLTATETGKPIPVEDILAVADSDGAEIPGYQTYLILAWLRKENLVDRVGGHGYLVREPENLEATVSNLRSALPEFRAA